MLKLFAEEDVNFDNELAITAYVSNHKNIISLYAQTSNPKSLVFKSYKANFRGFYKEKFFKSAEWGLIALHLMLDVAFGLSEIHRKGIVY